MEIWHSVVFNLLFIDGRSVDFHPLASSSAYAKCFQWGEMTGVPMKVRRMIARSNGPKFKAHLFYLKTVAVVWGIHLHLLLGW